uniref:Uncharacterized protein n=1 Tax=Rhizophora mucronata TaxID=61149 RepID=A0A2P2KR15_RHIMU
MAERCYYIQLNYIYKFCRERKGAT